MTAAVTSRFSYLGDDIELQVTITTEETVQLRLTYPSLGTLPTPVRVLVRFIDAVEFGKEDKVVDGEITDSGVILYEEDRAPYQRFKVQVALVVGDVTGPVFPQSLEDARVYGERACPLRPMVGGHNCSRKLDSFTHWFAMAIKPL